MRCTLARLKLSERGKANGPPAAPQTARFELLREGGAIPSAGAILSSNLMQAAVPAALQVILRRELERL